MSRNTPDQIIAHVDLLRAVDRLLEQARLVQRKREILERLLTADPLDEAKQHDRTTDRKETVRA
jgi:hypothetical protein